MVTQLAHEFGAYVIGTGRAADRQTALDFGANEFVDLDNEALEDVGGVDLVFDLIGGDVRFRSFPVLKSGGVITHISVPPMTQPPPRSDVEVRPAQVKYDTALLDQIGALLKSKAVRPVVSEVFAFADAVKAFQHVMTGHARGKVMLDMTR
jgi:NADPH:quinone reductase-like Zn-dependent oxidoreductase